MKHDNNIIKIALADDHTMLRKSLVKVMNNMEGTQVIIDEDNGKELIQKLRTAKELPEVCILDINMPEMDGYDTAMYIKEHWPQIKILALSMYDSEFNIIKMMRSGATGYILKDCSPDELYIAVTEINEHGQYLSNALTRSIINRVHTNTPLELDQKDVQFLQLCCTDLTYRQIAEKMYKSPRTIDGYRDDLFRRLEVTNRTGLVLYAIKIGLISNMRI